MFRSFVAWITGHLTVPDDDSDLLKAQFAVFSSQVPLMYSIVLVNSWALAYPFMTTAPVWLAVYVPLGLSLVCAVRLVGWWRMRRTVPTAQYAHQALTRTNKFAFVLSVGLTVWALSLYPYGDAYGQGNIAFFIAITGVGVIICLQQLRSAAFIVAIVINTSFVVYFSLAGIASFVGMATNMALVSIALLLVVAIQFRHFAGAVSARSELEAISRENAKLANLDSLTGLSNRRQFFAHLEAAVSESGDRRVAVGIIDLDGFKPINDLYGHTVGDNLLVEVGQRLAALAGSNVQISRLGGDEFAVTVTDCGTDDAELLAMGERLCTALRDPFVLAEATVQVSGSMGFSVYPHLAADAHELYERADYALYRSKRTNRGHPVLFTQEHVVEIDQSQRIEQVLGSANLAAEMEVVFQPIMDTRFAKVVSFEALARWTSPVLGKVPPDHFIPVAERVGLISELTCVLLNKALASASTWPEDVGLSFNLSTHDISTSDGVATIVGIILSSGVDPCRIDFEITETAMMYDFSQAKASIEIFQLLGCGIALDDFGTGYSSLSQLHALPLTKIKIDRSFVSGLHENPASYKIVKSLLALSSDMGLGCVIEGVETEEELAALKQLGCLLVQGYYYSPPVPAVDAANFLSEAGVVRMTDQQPPRRTLAAVSP
ncbi:EAL domain-containing protein [Hoeflea sp. YIM 152468]|uniref:putative bifunctional diguanylate cyclase/phosphodiesterase n=1 Tax=Hoeflea sp. YIM 152468 TaxID=3031759 RepID=UPI0023D9DE58|nr:EAL domain-containing protein [Hoeflea sp. YIM 152468]MDF1608336.1 EAL domain-containing protein [Hoeflea sp. YIM 152468]